MIIENTTRYGYALELCKKGYLYKSKKINPSEGDIILKDDTYFKITDCGIKIIKKILEELDDSK